MRPHALLLPALVALSLSLAGGAALAQPGKPAASQEDAKAHFQRGVTLFKEGDFRAALVEFRRAHEITGSYKILYNIGQTELELQDYAGALRSFEKYLAEGDKQIDAARRKAVEAEIKKLGVRVARVEIKTNAEGVEMLIDDVSVGKTPLAAPVLVSIGRRKVTALKAGQPPIVRYVDVAAGDLASVSFELAAEKPEPKPAPLPPPPPPPPPSRTGTWVSLGITGALVVGAVTTGVLALGARSDAEAKLGTLGVKASDVEQAHSKAATLALVTDIVGGAAIGMAVVTLVLGLTEGKRAREAPKAATLSIGPRGFAIVGNF